MNNILAFAVNKKTHCIPKRIRQFPFISIERVMNYSDKTVWGITLNFSNN